jgi:hypothetical protein
MKKQPKHLKSSDKKHTPGIRAGHPLAKHQTKSATSLKRKVLNNKPKAVKAQGAPNMFRPFMA